MFIVIITIIIYSFFFFAFQQLDTTTHYQSLCTEI